MKRARIRVMWILAFLVVHFLFKSILLQYILLKNSKVNAPYRQSEYLLENAH